MPLDDAVLQPLSRSSSRTRGPITTGLSLWHYGGTAFFPTPDITRYGSLRSQGRQPGLAFEMCECLRVFPAPSCDREGPRWRKARAHRGARLRSHVGFLRLTLFDIW